MSDYRSNDLHVGSRIGGLVGHITFPNTNSIVSWPNHLSVVVKLFRLISFQLVHNTFNTKFNTFLRYDFTANTLQVSLSFQSPCSFLHLCAVLF